ncbi:FGGY-family carbohydrate kinase [Actinomadura chibensis]|uniref:FGGY-family carbohydrate kinase n=1 Tax=Actinomadura chibensis TaxID=392828 RepID=UPI00082F3F3A|nr:FGGY-family carbohydrate kinase [Actinomadura chibensis]
MNAEPVLLGIDAGQTITKAVLFDPGGRELAAAEVPTRVESPRPRWQERDMDALWRECVQAVRTCLGRARLDPARVAAVGVCGHNDGAYLVDEALRPVRRAILATDSRAYRYAESARCPERAARALAVTGQVPFAASPAAVLAWLRDHEPESFARTRWTLFCKDWVRLRLTGAVATDPSEASASFTDVHTQEWSVQALELFGLAALSDRLPPILDGAAPAGTVTDDAAEATGLPPGTPVVTGAHDVDAAAIGVGAVAPGSLSLVLGTFSINQVVTDAPCADPRWQARSFVRPKQWLHMSTSPSGATNLEWAVRRFGPWRPDGAPDYASALAGAERGRPGHGDPPVYLPFLYGSPHSDTLGAALAGLRGWHDRDDVMRAVIEGVAFNHRFHVDALRERLDVRGPARLCGGGARSELWSGLLADTLGVAVEVTDAAEAGARGAAVLAGVGCGVYADIYDGVRRAVRVARRHEVDAAASAELDDGYARYRAVVEALLALPASAPRPGGTGGPAGGDRT